MGCCSSEQKIVIENEFDQIWGSLKKSNLFKLQQLQKHVNGKVYFELLFSKFLLYFYRKIQNKVADILVLEGDKLVSRLQYEIELMQLQKRSLKKKEEEIIKKYPEIVSDLLTGRSSNQQNQFIQKKVGSNLLSVRIIQQQKNQENRRSTLNQAEIGYNSISGESYQIPRTVVDQNDDKLEMSEMSYIKMETHYEDINKINEKMQFQKDRRKDHEDRIIILEKELNKVNDECNRLNKLEREAQIKDQLYEQSRSQLQELKKQSTELKKQSTELKKQSTELKKQSTELKKQSTELKKQSIELRQKNEDLLIQNNSLCLKIVQLENKLQSLTSIQQSSPKVPCPYNLPQQQQNNNIALRSFIILDPTQKQIQQDASQNIIRGCQIIFKLFPASKLLPNHTLFQTAVGVRTIIGEMFGRPIRGSKLLYSYDSITLSSFGKYIENHSNLFAIFRLKNGTLVGGFAGKIDEEGFLDSSFLFSVRSQREPIKIPAKRRVPRIDKEPGIMLFGAGELSIKIKTLELNCNLGCLQAYYGYQRKRTVSADVFLGDSESPQPLEGYQIYQLEFREV